MRYQLSTLLITTEFLLTQLVLTRITKIISQKKNNNKCKNGTTLVNKSLH